MLRGFRRVRNRVAVLPTMAAYPAPEASRAAEPARSASEEAPKSRGRTSRSSTSDGFSPTKARATDKLATAPLPKGDKPAVAASNKPATLAPPLDDLDNTRPARWGLPQVALIAAFLVVSAAGWSLYGGELANDVGLTIPPATQAGDDLAQVGQALQQERDKSEKLARELQAATAANKNAAHGQELNEVQRALQQEHDKAEQLARELAAAWRGLRSQATAMADNAAHDQQLSDLRQGLQHAEASAAAYREMLAQERARNQDLQQQLAVRGEASPDRGSNAAASLSETPTLPPTTEKQLALLPANGKPSEVILLIIAIVGTTVAPWQLFFQQSYVIDKRITPRFMRYERADLCIGIVLVVVGAVAIMAFTASGLRRASRIRQFRGCRSGCPRAR